MQIIRPSVDVIEVSDLASKIAVALANNHLLNNDILPCYYQEEMTEKELAIYSTEEAAILIDKVLKENTVDAVASRH